MDYLKILWFVFVVLAGLANLLLLFSKGGESSEVVEDEVDPVLIKIYSIPYLGLLVLGLFFYDWQRMGYAFVLSLIVGILTYVLGWILGRLCPHLFYDYEPEEA